MTTWNWCRLAWVTPRTRPSMKRCYRPHRLEPPQRQAKIGAADALPATALALGLLAPSLADAACCYFSAKNADILQPAQKVFITWDPVKQLESFTVQPKFEGNALDF